ncbi:FHA domain-containing protein [Streptomyces sp. NBRC 110611]|uniref:DUF4192 domain-containing protein n=1 Tax=Streptomyces sp. NBRC 110611 TaxID=1621259 RepID=UPI000858C69B|nr:DUF4192 domain-containing protein [Streptomyces sp. NBRC 110611]GAU69598.1 FHA domain-containing protein [Streptomyces sp. NBRC 110611]
MNPHSEPRKSEPRKHGTDADPVATPPPAPPTAPDPTALDPRVPDPSSSCTSPASPVSPTSPTASTSPTAPDSTNAADATSDPTSDFTGPARTVRPGGPADRTAPPAEAQVTLRGPAELADALPYLMGFYPDDSIVMVALHGERGRFGGRVRLGIPTDTGQWPDIADELAECLIPAGQEGAARPSAIVVYLCQEPAAGESGKDVKDRLRPLAQRLRIACGALDVPVLEALCLSNGRFWSYCCPDFRCCPAEGTPMVAPGTSVMAAAAAYAGMQVRGSLKEMEARLKPRTGPRAADQEKALDAAAARLLPRMLRGASAVVVREETLELASAMIHRFRQDTPAGSNRARDACDDALITDAEAAGLILGLQDRLTRDRAAGWMDGPAAAPALRLWRALARRCAGSYADHAVAPLTLAGWVCWSTEDGPSARVALGCALAIDPDYTFARLMHRAINEGLDPEPLRRCLREQHRGAAGTTGGSAASAGSAPADQGASRSTRRPGPVRPGAAARPRGPRGGTGPGARTTDGRGRRRAGRGDDRSRR